MATQQLFVVFTDNDTYEEEFEAEGVNTAVLGGSVLKVSTTDGTRTYLFPIATVFAVEVSPADAEA